MNQLPPPLLPLAQYPQFVVYKLVPSAKPDKFDKLPCDWRTGYVATAHNPAIWGTFEECSAALAAGRPYSEFGTGIGFTFTANDPFFFVDIDGCFDDEKGDWTDNAKTIINWFPGAAVEVSQSGKGLHIIGTGTPPEHRCKNSDYGLEFYHQARFVALTGINATGDATANFQHQLDAWVNTFFDPSVAAGAGPDEWTNEPVPEWGGPEDDEELIRRAIASSDRKAAKVFGQSGAVTFRDLWECNAEVLAKRWPSESGDEFDRSNADSSLASHLAFWTGKNCERIRQLMYQSGLVRNKWELRGDYYLPRTILRACSVSTEVIKKPITQKTQECTPGSLSLPGEKPTEESLCREIVTIFGDTWKYDHTIGSWYYWDQTHWKKDFCMLFNHLVLEHLREAGRVSFCLQIAKSKTVNAVEFLARSNPQMAVTRNVWNADSWSLGTPAGVINLKTGALRSANTKHLITKVTAVAPEQGEPQLWLRFLDEALGGDTETVEFVQRWCGYCLTGSTKEHVFAFIYGPGGNGKSVFLNTVTSILGDYSKTAALGTFTRSKNDQHPTELAMLDGARLVTASETDKGHSWSEAKVKAVTGGDPITARYMRQDHFTFQPKFKLMIAGNHAPSLRNVDEAMRRRLTIMPFDHNPQSPDAELENKLKKEWPLILHWMIQGCQAWRTDGLKTPLSITTATDHYFTNQDIFGRWLLEKCELGPNYKDIPSDLYKSWMTFAVTEGESGGTNKDFKAALEQRKIVTFKSNGKRYYRGAQLKDKIPLDEVAASGSC